MRGSELDCVRCDRFEIPDGYVAYKRTPVFDEGSIPPGLKSNHSTKSGVWAVIHVLSGQLRYFLDDLGGREQVLDSDKAGIVLPEVLHHIAADGPVRFFVEFHHRPGA